MAEKYRQVTVMLTEREIEALDRIGREQGKALERVVGVAAEGVANQRLEDERLAREAVEEARRQQLQKESRAWDWHTRLHTIEQKDITGRVQARLDEKKRFFAKFLFGWSPKCYASDTHLKHFELFETEDGSLLVYSSIQNMDSFITIHMLFEDVAVEELGAGGRFEGLGAEYNRARQPRRKLRAPPPGVAFQILTDE